MANKTFWREYKFRGQITEAAVSIMSNIAEGSAGEVHSKLCVALDADCLSFFTPHPECPTFIKMGMNGHSGGIACLPADRRPAG